MSVLTRSLLAALLLAVPVAAESVGLVPEGNQTGETLFIVGQLAGWTLVATVVRQLAAVAGPASRWGFRLTMAGTVLQVVFALLYLGSLVVSGEAWEGSFVVFLLAFLALTVGGILWAVRLRRGHRTAALGLAGVAGLGFVAIAAGDNVAHEVALLGSYLAWVVVGRGATVQDAAPGPVTAGSR